MMVEYFAAEERQKGGMGIYYSQEPMAYFISREEVEVDGGTMNVLTFPFYQVGSLKAGDMRITVSGDISYRQLLDTAASILSQSAE